VNVCGRARELFACVFPGKKHAKCIKHVLGANLRPGLHKNAGRRLLLFPAVRVRSGSIPSSQRLHFLRSEKREISQKKCGADTEGERRGPDLATLQVNFPSVLPSEFFLR
jgi:hypothetical protein